MSDEATDPDQAATPPGRLAKLALRLIDAGLHALQGWRARFGAPAEDEDGDTERRRPRREVAAAGAAPATAASAPDNSFLQLASIVLLCLLLGAGIGMLISYRGFSKQLDAQQKRVELMADEVRQSRKVEARNIDDKVKLKQEIVDYRQALREAEREIDDYQRRIAELETRLPGSRGAARATGAATTSIAARPTVSRRSGTCVTGTENSSSNVLDCITRFNRP